MTRLSLGEVWVAARRQSKVHRNWSRALAPAAPRSTHLTNHLTDSRNALVTKFFCSRLLMVSGTDPRKVSGIHLTQILGDSNRKENQRSLGGRAEWQTKSWGREKEGGRREAFGWVSGARGETEAGELVRDWEKSTNSIFQEFAGYLKHAPTFGIFSRDRKIPIAFKYIFLQVWTSAKTRPCWIPGLHRLYKQTSFCCDPEESKPWMFLSFHFVSCLSFYSERC